MSAPAVSAAVTTRVRLKEWETCPREPDGVLSGVYLPDDPALRCLVAGLAQRDMLHVEELRRGMRIRATSWVGRITLGGLEVTVEPKITGLPLLRLLRYAYGLRNLDLLGASAYDLADVSFVDLLVHQLAAEAEELIRRGLRREYVRRDADLAFPRGRLDVHEYALVAATAVAATTMPCTFYPRTEDTLLNRVLLAGLRLGGRLTGDPCLRGTLASRARMLEEAIGPLRLDRDALHRARREISRVTAAYRPALTLIELLVAAQGVSMEGEDRALQVPGFLLDMNRFFQALLSRFLSESLAGWQVRDEQRLCGMMTYDPLHNPRRRPAPTPRPDFVVTERGRIAAILDAKYRDLWDTPLPRDMLYQLALYALSRPDRRVAAILYPTLSASATEAHIRIHDAMHGGYTGRVILRPVNMLALASLVEAPRRLDERRVFAGALAFGAED